MVEFSYNGFLLKFFDDFDSRVDFGRTSFTPTRVVVF